MRITGRGADQNKMTRMTPTGLSQFAPAAAEETFLTEGQGVTFMLSQSQQRILASEARGKAILGVI
jgi:hypothetical protein